MAKKKSRKAVEKGPSFMESLGFKNIFQNEKVNFIIGILLFALAIFMVLSFISYFTTGQADQGLIEELREGEMMDMKLKFGNICNKFGAFTAYYFIKQCFGLSAFFIPVFLFLLAVRLMGAYKMSLWKWFLTLMVTMIWSSVTMAKFLSPAFEDCHFSPGGDHGVFICQWVENLVGTPGLTALLAIVAIIFLTYVSSETIYFIRKLLKPSKFFDRIKFKVIDTSREPVESSDSYVNQMKTLDDPTVFDKCSTILKSRPWSLR